MKYLKIKDWRCQRLLRSTLTKRLYKELKTLTPNKHANTVPTTLAAVPIEKDELFREGSHYEEAYSSQNGGQKRTLQVRKLNKSNN